MRAAAHLLRSLLVAWWVSGNEGTAAGSDSMLPLIIRLCYEPARRLCARHWNDSRQELYMCLLVTLPSERTPSYSPECWERLAWMRSNLKQRGGAAFLERRAKPTTRSKWERLSRERVQRIHLYERE